MFAVDDIVHISGTHDDARARVLQTGNNEKGELIMVKVEFFGKHKPRVGFKGGWIGTNFVTKV